MKKKIIAVVVLFGVYLSFGVPIDDRLIRALIQVESSGNDRAIGDRNKKDRAFGCLQIRQPCVLDVNRAYGTRFKSEDTLGNRTLSVNICKKYLALYATARSLGRNPKLEDMARIWNGGPIGWRRKTTDAYWHKVQKHLK